MTAPSIADIEAARRSHLCTSTDDGSLICVWCGKPWPCVVAQLLVDDARLTAALAAMTEAAQILEDNPPAPTLPEWRALQGEVARLTAALGEAEGERDALRNNLKDGRERDHFIAGILDDLDKAQADAATGRAVGRRLRNGWSANLTYYRWRRLTGPVSTTHGAIAEESMTKAEAAWLASLDEEERT